MEINVASMVMMAKYAIPEMEKNEGQWRGSIVNIASVAGIRGGNPHLLYPTSKGAIVNMTRAMAVHHGPQGIRVNCVCPGKSCKLHVFNIHYQVTTSPNTIRSRLLLTLFPNAA